MVKVSPFQGVMYNKEKVDNLDEVMSPPYDIISEEMQDQLYKKNDYNFVKLILNKKKPKDDETDNRYTRANKLFKSWLQKEILVKNKKKAVFPYKIEYKIKNESKTMNGFFILLRLDPNYEKVKAHERTLSKPKEDRLNLMRKCKANLEPIQLLYIDEEDELRKKMDETMDEPIIDVEGYDGFNHKLWKLEDEDILYTIEQELEDKILFIADGHHRYQTSINFAEEMKEKTGNKDKNAPFNYRLVILANMFDEGLSILPTHRLIRKSDINIEKMVEDSKKYFRVEEKSIDKTEKDYEGISKKIKKDIETEDEHKFAIYKNGKYYIFTLKNEDIMDDFAGDHSETWRTLDVSILHKIMIENLMDINEGNLEDHIKYTREDAEAISSVEDGKFDFSIIMNATKIEELKAVADAGEHMPQKSTYFLPKMLSGLVAYKM